jgi:hypothetical protein
MKSAGRESTRKGPSPENLLLREKRKTLRGLDPFSHSLSSPSGFLGKVPAGSNDPWW